MQIIMNRRITKHWLIPTGDYEAKLEIASSMEEVNQRDKVILIHYISF